MTYLTSLLVVSGLATSSGFVPPQGAVTLHRARSVPVHATSDSHEVDTTESPWGAAWRKAVAPAPLLVAALLISAPLTIDVPSASAAVCDFAPSSKLCDDEEATAAAAAPKKGAKAGGA